MGTAFMVDVSRAAGHPLTDTPHDHPVSCIDVTDTVQEGKINHEMKEAKARCYIKGMTESMEQK